MLEIYNENVVDLLAPSAKERPSLEIRQGATGVHVPDAVVADVNGMEDVERLMAYGDANRSVGSTMCNEHSSRSHRCDATSFCMPCHLAVCACSKVRCRR